MTDEQKAQVKADLHSGASRVAANANSKAKEAVGWRRWVYAAVAIIAGAVAFFTATGCTASYTQSASGDISANVTIVTPEPYRK
jgi:hypothetical protein